MISIFRAAGKAASRQENLVRVLRSDAFKMTGAHPLTVYHLANRRPCLELGRNRRL